uniref:Xaa-Pro aminopeptidase 1 n=1 Tax=Lygus hesperus TaxID=30085 RepID=A0A0A9XBG3_LYGHE
MDKTKKSSKTSSGKVTQIRNLFKKQIPQLNGYMVTSYDQHISEYVAERDKRLQFTTGFTGYTGKAIITETDAYLWVDGRYHIQADKEVLSPFRVMKSGMAGVPTELEWLIRHFQRGGVVGACGKYVPSSFWTFLSDKLNDFGIKLVDVKDCLVDLIWKDQKGRPCTELVPHPRQFSGQLVAEKIQNVRNIMNKNQVDILIVTELDDIAWLLNLRGKDIPHNPVFFSFLIIRKEYIDIFVDFICECVNHFLFNEQIHICDHEYDEFYDALHDMADDREINKIWVSDKANQRVHHSIPKRNCSCGRVRFRVSNASKTTWRLLE